MKRALVVLLGMLAWSAEAQGPVVKQLGSYHLNADALDRMAEEDPSRHARVSAILDAASRPQCENDATHRLKVSEDLQQLRCTALILTSHPARRHVYFILDGVAYSSRVVMGYPGAQLRKAEPAR